MADAVAQVATFTGMQPLADDLSLGGPTYAAFVARKDREPVVDLLLSVGTSLNLTLSLQSTPSGDQADVVARLLAHRADFPLLKAQTIPSPAVSRYEFTTSSLPVAGSREGTSSVLPDDAGTHILVIFIVRR
ncbi:MAG: hypothetical protein H5T84_03950 [Thermoleophilia bacterium]|nr:hypothetical protein [Thermoleophilia bacterium]